MAKGITTAKAKWEKEQNPTAEQLAAQKQQERIAELDRREAGQGAADHELRGMGEDSKGNLRNDTSRN